MKVPRYHAAKLALAIIAFGAALGGCDPWSAPPSHPIHLTTVAGATDTISIQCEGGDIRDITTRVALHFGLSIDLPADLHGYTSLNLRDVTWRQLFKVVLTPVGYGFYSREGVIVIRTAEEIRALPAVTGQRPLRHQSPAAILAYLQRLDPDLAATAVATPEGIAYHVHPARSEAIQEEIARVDSPEISLDKFLRLTRLPEILPGSLPAPPPAQAATDPVTTEIMMMEDIDAFLIRPFLERELKHVRHARIRPDVTINAIIVTAPEVFMPRLRAIIEYLDDPRWLVAE